MVKKNPEMHDGKVVYLLSSIASYQLCDNIAYIVLSQLLTVLKLNLQNKQVAVVKEKVNIRLKGGNDAVFVYC